MTITNRRGCRAHLWTSWARTGIFDSTERRDCRRCSRIETRKPRPRPATSPSLAAIGHRIELAPVDPSADDQRQRPRSRAAWAVTCECRWSRTSTTETGAKALAEQHYLSFAKRLNPEELRAPTVPWHLRLLQPDEAKTTPLFVARGGTHRAVAADTTVTRLADHLVAA